MVQEISTLAEFHALVSGTNQLVVVDFTATWCGPCQRIAPVLESLAQEFAYVTFVKVDVDQNKETAMSNGVRAMPTFCFFKGGSEIPESRLTGADPVQLKANIVKYGDKWQQAGAGHALQSADATPGEISKEDMRNARLKALERRGMN